MSSLRRGHANLLCIVPILTDDPRRESNNHKGLGQFGKPKLFEARVVCGKRRLISDNLDHQSSHRSHFGSRYTPGCCDLAGLYFFARVQSLVMQKNKQSQDSTWWELLCLEPQHREEICMQNNRRPTPRHPHRGELTATTTRHKNAQERENPAATTKKAPDFLSTTIACWRLWAWATS